MAEKKMGVGREDYEDRRENRVERLENSAAAARSKSTVASERAQGMASIMNGQPILVGHHSEGRHRRDLAKMDSAMRTSIEEDRKAKSLASAARSAETNSAVSSDDPDAVAKLQANLDSMEAKREHYKAHNKAARKAGKDKLPSYLLSNLGANIRRVKARIKELEARAGKEPRELEVGEWTVRENPETNRVELEVGRRATKSEYSALKSNGFKWSRTNEVWQRLANEAAWRSGVWLAEGFEKGNQ